MISFRVWTAGMACLAAGAAVPSWAQADALVGRHVKASLVAETDAARPGQPLTLGLRLQMEPGWHTYWRNPGDSGLPTRVRWELPAGFEAGEVRWPYPIRFRTGHLVSYGYEHEVLLPVEIRVPAATSGREARLAARVDWLECEEACLPGRAEVSLTLPVRGAAALGEHARLFAAARRRLPARDAGWRFAASPAGGAFRLAVHAPRGTALRDAYFFPLTPRLVDYSKPQPLRNEGAAYRLEIARDPNGAPAARLAGVLVAETASGTSALEVDVPLAAGVRKTSIDQEGKP